MSEDIVEPKVTKSGLVEMSMRISKASYNKSEQDAMRWTAIDSDVDSDLYDERMSIELYKDFTHRIENNTPIPEPFLEAICEADWCGGVPYLSIAHFKAGSGLMNVPGAVESVFVDGTRLKSKGTLNDTEMGRRVFKALREDLYMKEKSVDHKPVRISIGFLDLEHKHQARSGGQEFTFTRSDVGQICPLCAQGIGGKIYTKGQLIHLAMTRVPVNPRTEMSLTERSMDDITTKKQDAASIIGEDLADGLEEKSIASDMLVVRSDNDGGDPASVETRAEIIEPVVKSEPMPQVLFDEMVAQLYKSHGYKMPVVEDKMDQVVDTVEEVEVAPAAEVVAEVVAAEEKSALDTAFESLKSLIVKAQAGELDTTAINGAFALMGTEVEKAVKPAPQAMDASNMEAVIKSAVESAVAPLIAKIAMMEAAQKSGAVAVNPNGVVQSKSLSLNFASQKPEDVIQRALGPIQPERKLTQIERIARRSTGADRS